MLYRREKLINQYTLIFKCDLAILNTIKTGYINILKKYSYIEFYTLRRRSIMARGYQGYNCPSIKSVWKGTYVEYVHQGPIKKSCKCCTNIIEMIFVSMDLIYASQGIVAIKTANILSCQLNQQVKLSIYN